MKYRDHLRLAMTQMAATEPRFIAVGYNCCESGGYGGGMFKDVPKDRIYELPLAERLNASVAIGMSLGGYIPLQWTERQDFTTLCYDGWINHLDKLSLLSGGIHKPAVIILTATGKRTVPLFSGPTHTQDFTQAIQSMVSFPCRKLLWPSSIPMEFDIALQRAQNGQSTMLILDNDLLESE